MTVQPGPAAGLRALVGDGSMVPASTATTARTSVWTRRRRPAPCWVVERAVEDFDLTVAVDRDRQCRAIACHHSHFQRQPRAATAARAHGSH
jgi:hypothetical protein